MLLIVVSTNVFAEWTWFGENGNGDTTVYMDYETIKRNGNNLKMWILYDFKTVKKSPGGKEYLSLISRHEYNCEEETTTTLDSYGYSGNMRTGVIVESVTNIKDEPISVLPGSIVEGLLKIACGKK